MADTKKSVTISSLIALGIVAISMISPSFFEEDKFYCEVESSIIACPGGLSSGTATRCYLNTEKTSWDYCKGGWTQVTNDLVIQEKEPEIPIYESDIEKQLCKEVGCAEI